MKRLLYILLFIFFACEEVVIVELPASQNLVVVQGWVTDSLGSQPIRITRSNSFASDSSVDIIEHAEVFVVSKEGDTIHYSYEANGFYHSNTPFRGINGVEYRVLITIDTMEIKSEWDKMPENVPIENLQFDFFEENDPNNPSQQITIFYPKITSRDPGDVMNFYRWVFYKNGEVFNDPDPIVIQNDRLFNGNLIPNNFQNFGYDSGNEMTVQLVSISENTHNYLKILRSQITTLGTSSGTTPAIVNGNLFFTNNMDQQVLGFFGAVSESTETITLP
ncbi:DUF4249 domain-containing protein [Ekhidna sp.]|uniref:DUF4249 domain-containing protein n=1 Tax=Ekhidna sp. TaxID=2608089 RepID=UPI0032ECCBE6